MVSDKGSCLGDYFSSSRDKGEIGLPLLSVTLHDGIVGRDKLDRRTETNLAPEDHLLVREGDIAYNMMRVWQGALGRAQFDGIVSPAYIVLRAKKNVDTKYAEYFFNTSKMIYLFWAYSYGITSDRLRLYFNDFKRIPVIFPPLAEQRKVVKILSSWDKAICVAEKLVDNSAQQKKSLMQKLFGGDKRFPEYDGKFKRCHFSDVLEIDSESLGSKTSAEFKFKYISLSDVDAGNISDDVEVHLFASSPSRARRIVRAGDILLATVRPNLQGFAVVKKEHEGFVASTGFAVLRPRSGVCGDYIYHYLFSAHIAGQINYLVVGTNYPAINSSDVAGLSIYCPEYEEQLKIAAVLNACDAVIVSLKEKVELLRQEKKALMQRLLNGKCPNVVGDINVA